MDMVIRFTSTTGAVKNEPGMSTPWLCAVSLMLVSAPHSGIPVPPQ